MRTEPDLDVLVTPLKQCRACPGRPVPQSGKHLGDTAGAVSAAQAQRRQPAQ